MAGTLPVKVPAVWQNYGVDRHQYLNTRYPFPFDPPYVPRENPCGLYQRQFLYHRAKAVPRAFLNFEGVDSCFYIWVNGIFTGYSQVSYATSEFDVTDVLVEGENTITVLVLKWCDGSYHEDQDKFRMSGIFRDVYLLTRPENGIRDYTAKAGLRADGAALVEVSLTYFGDPVETNYVINDMAGRELERGTTKDGAEAVRLERPKLWSAETPYLYTVTFRTEGEYITDRFGIREIKVEQGVLYINGTAVKFHGVNRHDSDPDTGCYISREKMERDLRLMKEHNVNAVRTSHYPNSPQYRTAPVLSSGQWEMKVRNGCTFDFTTLGKQVSVVWEMVSDGQVTASRRSDADLAIPPHQQAWLDFEMEYPASGRCFLRIRYLLKKDIPLVKEGHELGFDEIEIPQLLPLPAYVPNSIFKNDIRHRWEVVLMSTFEAITLMFAFGMFIVALLTFIFNNRK